LISVNEDEQPPVATFKTSLRNWQARWKAQRTTQAPISGKELSQAAPTERPAHEPEPLLELDETVGV